MEDHILTIFNSDTGKWEQMLYSKAQQLGYLGVRPTDAVQKPKPKPPTTSIKSTVVKHMSATGVNCKCGKPIDSCSDTAEDDYCSLYCHRFYTEGHKKIPLSDSKHHKNHPMKYPPIEQSCDMCGNTFNLGYNDSSGRNRSRFCSRQCYFELIGSRRHAKKKWIILRILDQRGPLTSGELGRIMDKFDTKGNARVIGSTMRPWIAKGWVDRYDAGVSDKFGKKLQLYELVYDGPIGQMIHPNYTAKI